MYRPFLAAFLTLAPLPALAQSFTTDAPHALIIDQESGLVLFEKDARDPMPPASMTKIMTAQMVFDALKSGEITEDQTFQVSTDAWTRGGVKSGSSTMFLKVKSEVSVIDLLRGVIVQSGNDACITLAEGMAGSEAAFATLMTQKAKGLGLTSANFENATGWPDPGHEISAYDLGQLTRHQIATHPDYYALYGERNFTWNGISQPNRNPLLGRVRGADGVKTGSTSVSGYGLVGSAERDGTRRIIVINGLDSQAERARVATELMTAAFTQFDIADLFASGDALGDIPVYMGKQATVSAVLREDITLGFAKVERATLKARIDYRDVPAPIAAGDKIAELVITKGGKDIGRHPLYAENDVARKGFFARAVAALSRKIGGA